MDNNFSIAFNIGSLQVHWYSIFMFLAIVSTYTVAISQAKLKKIPIRPLENFLFIGLISGFIGARIFFLIGNHTYVHSFYDVIAVWNGGISIIGGVIFASIAAIVYFLNIKNKYEISMWVYLDIILTSVLIGQVIGRWGNFFNQEILGPKSNPNSFPLILFPDFIKNHLHYSKQGMMDPEGTYRQPLFFYESFLNFLMFVYLLFLVNNKRLIKKVNKKFTVLIKFNNGSKCFVWFMWYGLLRIILEPLRASIDILQINHFPISLLFAFLFFMFGTLCFLFNQNIIEWNFWKKNVKIK